MVVPKLWNSFVTSKLYIYVLVQNSYHFKIFMIFFIGRMRLSVTGSSFGSVPSECGCISSSSRSRQLRVFVRGISNMCTHLMGWNYLNCFDILFLFVLLHHFPRYKEALCHQTSLIPPHFVCMKRRNDVIVNETNLLKGVNDSEISNNRSPYRSSKMNKAYTA